MTPHRPCRPIHGLSLDGFQFLEVLEIRGNFLSSISTLVDNDLPRLRRLNVGGNPIDDKGLEGLHRLNQLKSLDLLNTAVTSEGLKQLASLFSLNDLGLPNMPISQQRELKIFFDENRRQARAAGIEVPPDSESPFAYLDGPFFKRPDESTKE